MDKALRAFAVLGDGKDLVAEGEQPQRLYSAPRARWFAANVRGEQNPAVCKKGSDRPVSAQAFLPNGLRSARMMLDPKTMKYTLIDTCSALTTRSSATTRRRAGSEGSGPVAGWLDAQADTDETGDAVKAQGYGVGIDANGDGKADELRRPGNCRPKPAGHAHGQACDLRRDAASDRRLGLVHVQRVRRARAASFALDPKTRLSQFYALPAGYVGLRGGDIDKNGVAWSWARTAASSVSTAGSANAPSTGGTTGNHCPEGFAVPRRFPGPGHAGFENNSAGELLHAWSSPPQRLGLGNLPIATGNLNGGFIALKDGKMVMLRIPYPLGFFAKGLDGRIDDPNAGWKGRGIWSTNGDRTPWLMEGGKGSRPRAVHIQVRPDPLAR